MTDCIIGIDIEQSGRWEKGVSAGTADLERIDH
jgi:hypothetical protein